MKWRPISEKGPEAFDWVLVKATMGQWQTLAIASWDGDNWEFIQQHEDKSTNCPFAGDCVGLINPLDITHWMYIKDLL